MLEEVLQSLNNWFLVPDGIHTGEFTVQGRVAHARPFLTNRTVISGWWGLSSMTGFTNTRPQT